MSYILFPISDYNKLLKFRNSAPLQEVMKSNKVESGFSRLNFEGSFGVRGIRYEVNENLKDVNIVIISNFRVHRDSLVAHVKSHLPFTDTPEYRKLFEEQILYWNGKKLIKEKVR